MTINQIQKPNTSAWVIFSGKADLPWLRILKPGFRHCYVLLNDGQSWFSLDPMSNYTDINIHHHVPPNFDLPLWLKDRGHEVVSAAIDRTKIPAPWMPFTCVEAVKRVLGLRSCLIWTPFQLYRHLTKTHQHRTLQEGEFVWEV